MSESFSGSRIIAKAQEATHDVLEKTGRLLLDELSNHIAKYSPNGIEPLIGGADVVETVVVQQYLLHDEDGDRLAELGPGFHDPKAERDDLRSKEKIDHLARIVLNQGANYTKRGEAEILERSRLGGRV